jgi:hypothetical protein
MSYVLKYVKQAPSKTKEKDAKEKDTISLPMQGQAQVNLAHGSADSAETLLGIVSIEVSSPIGHKRENDDRSPLYARAEPRTILLLY